MGEKLYERGVSLKTFSVKSYLVTVMRNHTREKRYTFKVCLKTFGLKS